MVWDSIQIRWTKHAYSTAVSLRVKNLQGGKYFYFILKTQAKKTPKQLKKSPKRNTKKTKPKPNKILFPDWLMEEKSKLLGRREGAQLTVRYSSICHYFFMIVYKPILPMADQLDKSMHYLLMVCPAGVCSTSYPSLLKTSITVLLPMKWPAVKRKMTSELKEHRERERRTTKSFLITGGTPHSGQAVLYHSTPACTRNTGSLTNDCWTFPRSLQLPHSAFLKCRCDWNDSGPTCCCIIRPLWISWDNKRWSWETPVQEQHWVYNWWWCKADQNLAAVCASF